mgnify:CR=1 FL=1
MKPMRSIIYPLTLLLLSSSPLCLAREKIIFTCAMSEDFPLKALSHKIYSTAFDALGYDFELRLSADLRSVVDAANGTTDGVCSRVYNYNELSGIPNLIRVESPVAKVAIEVWGRNTDLSMSATGDLPTAPSTTDLLKVGHKRGSVWIERYLKTQHHADITQLVDVPMGMKMLGGGRLDIFVGIGPQIGFAIKHFHLEDRVHLIGTLATLELYPYLNIRHRELAAPLAEQLNSFINEHKPLIKSWKREAKNEAFAPKPKYD